VIGPSVGRAQGEDCVEHGAGASAPILESGHVVAFVDSLASTTSRLNDAGAVS
jgi:hypothetical protein